MVDPLQEIYDVWGQPGEVLHPDLVDLVEEDGKMPMLRHPLVFAVPYAPLMNGPLNRQYEAKKEAVKEALESGNWSSYINLHERPYRIDALHEIADLIEDDAEYWRLVREAWEDTEFPHANESMWRELFESERPQRHEMMDSEEIEALAALPEVVVIHRGYSGEEGEDGMSWTLDRDKAEWFSKRFSHRGEPQVVTRQISKDNILALILTRQEQEVLII